MSSRSVRARRGTSEVYGRTVDSIYIDGNTVRKVERRYRATAPRRSAKAVRRHSPVREVINVTEPLIRVSLSYYLFLFMALAISAAVCIWYVRVQSEITASQKEVYRLESELSTLKHDNDEERERILGQVDIEAIKRTAMTDLGMRYPAEDQVVIISGAEEDYVRQYEDIPEN